MNPLPWPVPPSNDNTERQLRQSLGIELITARCLINRGRATEADAADFLSPRLKSLADPFALRGMEAFVNRLHAARAANEGVLIYGDYDADGVTSSAILEEVLTELGWRTSTFLPNRFNDGYGLNFESAFKAASASQSKILISVDCGTTAAKAIAQLQTAGIEVLVLDHHLLEGAPAPECIIVNPHLSGEGRFTELCSAGLAFKVAHALVKQGRAIGSAAEAEYDVRNLLDLVTIGTVADSMPLLGENRHLVTSGLEYLNKSRRPGLVQLKNIAQFRPGAISPRQVAMQIAPRINAPGRLADPMLSLRLLRTTNPAEATQLATATDGLNNQRRELEKGIQQLLFDRLDQEHDPINHSVIVAYDQSWHAGVIGIVASKVVERYQRPAILLTPRGDHWIGSARTLDGIDVVGILAECSDLLLRYGGHAAAGGLSIEKHQIEPFRQRARQLVTQRRTGKRVETADSQATVGELKLKLILELNRLAPFGQGNQPPRLAIKGARITRGPQTMGDSGQHAKFQISDGMNQCEVVAWQCRDLPNPARLVNLLVEPGLNEYQGRQTVQLRMLDWNQD